MVLWRIFRMARMTCEEAGRRLSLLMDGELPLHEEEETLRHVDGCAECRAYRDKLRQADGRLGAVADRMAPPLSDVHAVRFAAAAVAAPPPRVSMRRSFAVMGGIAALVLLAL